MQSHSMSGVDWSMMIGFYVAVFALLVTALVLLAHGVRGR